MPVLQVRHCCWNNVQSNECFLSDGASAQSINQKWVEKVMATTIPRFCNKRESQFNRQDASHIGWL